MRAWIRPSAMAAAFLIGAIFPELGKLNWAIRWLLVAMMFLIFLKLDAKQLLPRASHWLLLGYNLLFPLLLWFILNRAGHRELAEAAFFTAVTPTASAAPVIMSLLEGEVSFVVSSFIITNFGVPLALNVLLPVCITHQTNWSGFLTTAANLLQLIALPFILAGLVRRFWPRAAGKLQKTGNLSFTLWVILLTIIAGAASAFMRQHREIPLTHFALVALLSLGICLVNFSVGYLLGGRRFRREASQSLGQKNTSFTIVLAATFASPLAAMGPAFYVLWHNLWNAIQLYRHDWNAGRFRKPPVP